MSPRGTNVKGNVAEPSCLNVTKFPSKASAALWRKEALGHPRVLRTHWKGGWFLGPSQVWRLSIDDAGEFYFLSQGQPATPKPAAVTRKQLLRAFNTCPQHGTAWRPPREATASGRHLRLTASRQRRGRPEKSLAVIKAFTGKDQYLPRHGPPGRMPATPSVTACCGQVAPGIELKRFQVSFPLGAESSAFVGATGVCGVERIRLRVTDLTFGPPRRGRQETGKPFGPERNAAKLPNSQMPAAVPKQRLQLGGLS